MAGQIPVEDPTSQSNYTQIVTTNVSLDWTVDFEKRCIHGSATHQLVAKDDVSEVMCVDLAITALIPLNVNVDVGLSASTRMY